MEQQVKLGSLREQRQVTNRAKGRIVQSDLAPSPGFLLLHGYAGLSNLPEFVDQLVIIKRIDGMDIHTHQVHVGL